MKKLHKKVTTILKGPYLKKSTEILFVSTILTISIFTRFSQLGYSDYIGDEHKAFIELKKDQTIPDFFMSRRKGPMQFIVSHIPYLITGDFTNEFAQRIPFSIISVLSMLVFYSFVKKITKNMYVSFLATFLLTINGFIVGFGRIAQYQNLNLLFSFLALFFYIDLLEEDNKKFLLRSSLLGTLFWCLSILSHWDAVFIFPVVVIVFYKFLKSRKLDRKFKQKLVAGNFLLGCLLLLPFLLPYINYQTNNPENIQYFERRLEFGHVNYTRYKLLTDLYNPFVTFYLLFTLGLLGIFLIRKSYFFSAWFIFSYTAFELFVRKPGTHIYNFIIPLTILSAISICTIYKTLPRCLKKMWVGFIAIIFAFLFYQTHYIFINHQKEYPWEQKVLYDFTKLEDGLYDKKKVKAWDRVYHKIITPKYTIEQKTSIWFCPQKILERN